MAEYAIVLTVIVMALAGMQIYVKRSLQARYKGAVENLVSGISAGTGKAVTQYDPYYLESNITENKTSDVIVGFPESSVDQTVNRSGWQRVGPAE